MIRVPRSEAPIPPLAAARQVLADVHVGVGVRSRSRVICIIIGFGTGSNPSCSHEALARGPTSFLVVQLSPRGDKSLRGGSVGDRVYTADLFGSHWSIRSTAGRELAWGIAEPDRQAKSRSASRLSNSSLVISHLRHCEDQIAVIPPNVVGPPQEIRS